MKGATGNMEHIYKNPLLNNEMLPVDIVLHPSWWYHHEGITFDEDFYYHPKKRVESERKMERVLYERWGKYGFGQEYNQDIPQVGAVHLAAGFLISEMLGCQVEYKEDTAPQVVEAYLETLDSDPERAFQSLAFKKFEQLAEELKIRYGYVKGDVNWSGILNIAIDLRGQNIFMDMFDRPQEIQKFFGAIAQVIEQFVTGIARETGTTSISVNRNVRNIPAPVYLHSECSHTMISVNDYEKYLLPFDIEWSKRHRPYGIHYCGVDPHRYAEAFAKVPHLDFLDVGWGGDIKILRKHLPETFFNIRLSPVEIIHQSVEDIRNIITTLVKDSGNPWLTGVCCINMDHQVSDEKITAIFETVAQLRQEYARH
jgi:hypothetical protein